MPSFFDYLRKRVYDAILLGAQEAFEHLENDLGHDLARKLLEGSESEPAASKRSTNNRDQKPAKQPVNSELLDFGGNQKTLPPRKRGRPRGKKNRAQ